MLTRGIALWHNCGLLLSRGRSIHGVSVCGGGIDDDLNAIDGQWTWTVFPRINIFMSFRQMVRIHVVQEGVRLARPVGKLLHKMAWCAMDVCWGASTGPGDGGVVLLVRSQFINKRDMTLGSSEKFGAGRLCCKVFFCKESWRQVGRIYTDEVTVQLLYHPSLRSE